MTMIGRCCLCSGNCPSAIGYVNQPNNILNRVMRPIYSIDFPRWADSQIVGSADFPSAAEYEPDDISLMVMAIGLPQAFRGYARFPRVQYSLDHLEKGKNIIIINEYFTSIGDPSAERDEINTYLDNIGCTMRVDGPDGEGKGWYSPRGREYATVHPHPLTTGVNVWETAASGRMSPNAATVLMSHSSGGATVAVEESGNGKVVMIMDWNGFVQNYNLFNDSDRFLHNIYYDSTAPACFPENRKYKVGLYDDYDIFDWKIKIPYGAEYFNMGDADFYDPNLATVVLGIPSGYSEPVLPESGTDALAFLANGGNIIVTCKHVSFVDSGAIAECNNFLNSIGCRMRFSETNAGPGGWYPIAFPMPILQDIDRLWFGTAIAGTDTTFPGSIVGGSPMARFPNNRHIRPAATESVNGGTVVCINDAGFFNYGLFDRPSGASSPSWGNYHLMENLQAWANKG